MSKDRGRQIVFLIKVVCMVIFAILLLVLFYWYGIRDRANNTHTHIVVSASAEEIVDCEEYKEKKVMEQTITSENSNISVIQLMFRKADNQTIQAPVKVSLFDKETESLVQKWDISVSDIIEYQYQILELENPLKYQENKTYIIRVESEDLGCVSPAVTNYAAYDKGNLIVEGVEQIGDMVFILQGSNQFFKTLYVLFGVVIIIGGLALIMYYKLGKGKVQNYFLIMGITWGSLFLLMFVPYTAPDETAHLATVYANANKIMGKEVVDDQGYTLVRAEDQEVLQRNKLSFDNFLYYYGKDHSGGSEEIVSYSRWPLNIPFVAHLPQTIGVTVGLLFHANAVITLYMGKLAALMFYLCCCYLAISWIPWGKMMLSVIALFPMSLELATSFSYDCTVISLSFLFIAYTMKLIYEKEHVNWKDYVVLGLIAAWMAPCKVAYLFVCGLVFAIPKKKSSNPKLVWVAQLGVFCIGGILVVVQRMSYINRLVNTQAIMGAESADGFTMSQILQNQGESLRMLITTYFAQTDLYLKEIVGGLLGVLQINISWKIIVGFILILCLTLLLDYGEHKHMKWNIKLLSIVLAVIMIGGIVLSMWLDCSTTDVPYILGVQGRYFIPILPMVLLALKPNIFEIKKNINHLLFAGVYILEFLTMIEIWRYAVQ